MAEVKHEPKLVADPTTGGVLKAVEGQAGTVVYRGTSTPATLQTYSGVPMTQPIHITPDGFVPGFKAIGNLPDILYLDWVSGSWIIPLNSAEGVYALTLSAAAAADAAADAAAAAGKTITAGANVTVTPTQDGTGVVIASTGGGSGGTTTVEGLTDATATGKNLVKAANAAAARSTIGAGTSDLALGTTGATAAAGDAVVRLTGAQTVQGQKTFQTAPVVPAESFPLAATAGLADLLADLQSRPGFVVVANQGDDPIAAGGRPGDVVVYTTPTTGGGGTDPEPPADTTSLRRRFLTGQADNTALTLAGGTGDTPITRMDPSTGQLVQVVAGKPYVHVTGSSAQTWRDNSAGVTNPGDLPVLGVFSFDIGLRIIAYPASTVNIAQLTGVFKLALSATGTITVLNDASAAAPSSVGGTAGAASTAIPLMTDADTGEYHIKGWRSSTAAGTLTRFTIYKPDGTVHWAAVNRDVGVANGTAWLRGKTGSVAGEWLIGQERLDDIGTELATL